MTTITRMACASARFLSCAATALVCALSAPTAQAERVARGGITLDFSTETAQSLDTLRIRAGFDLVGFSPRWPSWITLGGTSVHAADTTPITISSAQGTGSGFLTMAAPYGQFDIAFGTIDFVTGVVSGNFITWLPNFEPLVSAFQPLLIAKSVTGGGPLTMDQAVTVTLHDLAGSQALFDMMAAHLGQFGPQIQAQNLITLQAALRDMGDITVTYRAEVPFDVTVVPEPASGLLMGLGLAAVAGGAQARRRAAAASA
jgi:PEP-CTERM motif